MRYLKLPANFLFFAVFFSSALLRSSPLSAQAPSAKPEIYIIGREDVLEISVWQSPDLSKTLTVGPEGTIPYPILGDIVASGRSSTEVQQDISNKLSQGYVKDPKVTVSIKEYNSKKILVFGEVDKPGLYKLKGNIPLLELLFLVGGVKPAAKRMTVIRPQKLTGDATPPTLTEKSDADPSLSTLETVKPLEVDLIALLSRGDLSQNIFINPGDTIYVSSGTGERFYVLGQVENPGPYEWVQEITVLEALKLAGGATLKAATNRINVVHSLPGGRKVTAKVNVGAIMQGKKTDDVNVKAGDMIVVPESWI